MSLFQFKIDTKIKHIFFFKKNETFLKKCYIYVTESDDVVIKGLPMIKNDSSKIGKIVFNEYMRNDVRNGNIKFQYEDVKSWLYKELEKDINIVARSFKVKPLEFYKNKTQLQAQISEKYGTGTHKLIQNKRVGVGCGSKYCSIKEFKDNGLNIDDLDLGKFWNEMEFFTDIPQTVFKNNRVGKVFRVPKLNPQTNLSSWATLL